MLDLPDSPSSATTTRDSSGGGFGDLRQITRVFEAAMASLKLPHVEAIQWTGEDGTQIEGLLYYPLGHPAAGMVSSKAQAQQPVETAPLVVSTHGGPASANVFKWVTESEYIPQLCALGYFVLQVRAPAPPRGHLGPWVQLTTVALLVACCVVYLLGCLSQIIAAVQDMVLHSPMT